MPKQDMTFVTSAWPFSQWGIDTVGALPVAPGKVKFLVVAIDYFTKWVEAKPLASITGNGQMEVTNKDIIKGIKRRLGQSHHGWVDKLQQVLWAHKTHLKSSHEETPFSITYGIEVVIPSEIIMETKRIEAFEESKNDKRLRENLDLLEELREIASIREDIHKQKIERYYNTRVSVTPAPNNIRLRSEN
uniref:Reverse transcriptase domain-containing protein n=1 Tax=Tanacetum cinerariifolium TaxID=118510 RepID=A0A6L2KQG2_TANCI|nr:reverse transcriptase domain-containing protein [Tanacetum cinerariifolium]